MLMNTGTEEISHIEMLATAVALNLEGAPNELKDKIAKDNPLVESVMGGIDPRHILSSGLSAMATDANGNPFNGSWIIGTGNIAANMYANVNAEASGRLLATRLYEMTDDPGMKDMLSFLIARDTMHQNQWLAVLEELKEPLPVPNSFPKTQENKEFNYSFIVTDLSKAVPEGRYTSGKSIDGKGEFNVKFAEPMGEEPVLPPPSPKTYAQNDEMDGLGKAKTVVDKVVDKIKK